MSRIRANQITNKGANGAPNFPNGITATGIITATVSNSTLGTLAVTGNATIDGNLGVGGTITYEDVARVDATGISTFREGFKVGPLSGIGLTAYKDGSIRTSGIVTAYQFKGDGSNVTGIAAGNISSGTVGTARLGSGTANNSVFLRGDSSWAAVTQTTINNNANNRLITGSGSANTLEGEANMTFDGETLQVVSHVIGTKYADVLILGSGGGGGTSGGEGGGGGAGAFAKYYGVPLRKGKVYTATIGAGGPGSVAYNDDNGEGNKTTFTGPGAQISPAFGGGCGGCYPLQAQIGKGYGTGKHGASGGGGGGNYNANDPAPHWGGNGTGGGYPGAHGKIDSLYLGGGGGGAGQRGSMGSGSTGGNGGNGLADSITGSSITYCGGGGGNSNGGPGGTGGSGGGGNNTASGGANRGGGGGAGGGTGGSGVVILRVLTSDYSGASTSGSPTVTTDGSYTVIKFTGTGTYTA